MREHSKDQTVGIELQEEDEKKRIKIAGTVELAVANERLPKVSGSIFR